MSMTECPLLIDHDVPRESACPLDRPGLPIPCMVKYLDAEISTIRHRRPILTDNEIDDIRDYTLDRLGKVLGGQRKNGHEWLRLGKTVLEGRTVDVLRRRANLRHISVDARSETGAAVTEVPSPARSPEEAAWRNQRTGLWLQAIRAVAESEDEKSVLALLEETRGEISTREIGRLLGFDPENRANKIRAGLIVKATKWLEDRGIPVSELGGT